jgi:hypothetical protein
MKKGWPRIVCHSCNAVLAKDPDMDSYRWRPCPHCSGHQQAYGVKIGDMELYANKTVPEET